MCNELWQSILSHQHTVAQHIDIVGGSVFAAWRLHSACCRLVSSTLEMGSGKRETGVRIIVNNHIETSKARRIE